MYWKHWGLSCSPFRRGLDSRGFYSGSPQEEVLSRLDFLVRCGGQGGLLVGEPGTGKSLLLQVFGKELATRGFAVVRTSLLGADSEQLLWTIAAELGIAGPWQESMASLWRRLHDRLGTMRFDQQRLALLVDNADQAGPDGRSDLMGRPVLIQLVRIAQSFAYGGPATTVVLAVRPQSANRIGSRLQELVELRMDLRPWTEREVADFLRQVLARSGRTEPIFSEDAVARLHVLSGGIPRHVHQLADLALVAGAGQKAQWVTPALLDSVHTELGVLQVTA